MNAEIPFTPSYLEPWEIAVHLQFLSVFQGQAEFLMPHLVFLAEKDKRPFKNINKIFVRKIVNIFSPHPSVLTYVLGACEDPEVLSEPQSGSNSDPVFLDDEGRTEDPYKTKRGPSMPIISPPATQHLNGVSLAGL